MIRSWKYKDRVYTFITEEQLPEIVKILHDPEVEKYLYFAPVTLDRFRGYTLPIIEGQKKALQEGRNPDSAVFAVMEDDELLGVCGVSEMPDCHNVSMVGCQLKRSAWGKGVGVSTLEFVIHYAQSYSKVRKLFGDCMTENIGSARIMEKCGFSFEGVIKEKYEVDGHLLNNSWYGLKMEDVTALPQGAVQELQ